MMQNQTTSVYVPVETPDNKIWAFMLALLVHGGVIGFILYTNHVKNLDGEAMETSIITPDELAAMQGQVRANQAAANAQAGQAAANAQAGQAAANPSLTMSPEAAKLNAELVQKQAKWQQQQAAIATQLDKEAMQEQQDFANQIKQQNIEQSQQLNDFKESELTPDTFDEHRDDAPKGKITMSNAGGAPSKTSKSDTASHEFGKEGSPTATGKSNGQTQNGTGSNAGSRVAYRKLVESIVESNWNPPPNTPVGTRVSAKFSISASGAISHIRVGNDALSESLAQAIQNSSLPAPPTDNGVNYADSTMGFTIKQK